MNDLANWACVVAAASASVVSLAIAYLSYKVLKAKNKYKHLPGPEANGIMGFFLGNFGDIQRTLAKGNIPMEFFTEITEKYGDTYKFRLLDTTFVFTCDPKLIKEILIDQDCPKNPAQYHIFGYPAGERFLGDGLLTETDTEVWKHRRSYFNPGFHRQALISFLTEFNSKSNVLVEYLMSKADGKTPVNLLKSFNATTLDVIASVAFSMNLDTINNPDNEFNKNITKSLSGLIQFLFDPIVQYKPSKWSFIRESKKVFRYLRDIGRKALIARLNAMKNGDYLPNDILQTILEANKDDEIDIEKMVDDFVTFFIAGQETTASALAFIFMELGRNPDILQKVREEVDRVIGSKPEVTFDDLNDLKYTSAVFKEALRLYPPAPAVNRLNKKEIVTPNFVIPKDSYLLLSIFASGRNGKFIPEPLEFRPERFLNEDQAVNSYTNFPFSLGPRNCIGQNFALFEGKVIIVKMIQNFDFELDANQSFKLRQEGTIRPFDGVRCFLKPRK